MFLSEKNNKAKTIEKITQSAHKHTWKHCCDERDYICEAYYKLFLLCDLIFYCKI